MNTFKIVHYPYAIDISYSMPGIRIRIWISWNGEGNEKKSTQDKSIAQLSMWARLWTMATLLCKLPALPSFGMRLGGTNLTCQTCHWCQCQCQWGISSNTKKIGRVCRERERQWKALRGGQGREGSDEGGRIRRWRRRATASPPSRRVAPSRTGRRCWELGALLPLRFLQRGPSLPPEWNSGYRFLFLSW